MLKIVQTLAEMDPTRSTALLSLAEFLKTADPHATLGVLTAAAGLPQSISPEMTQVVNVLSTLDPASTLTTLTACSQLPNGISQEMLQLAELLGKVDTSSVLEALGPLVHKTPPEELPLSGLRLMSVNMIVVCLCAGHSGGRGRQEGSRGRGRQEGSRGRGRQEGSRGKGEAALRCCSEGGRAAGGSCCSATAV